MYGSHNPSLDHTSDRPHRVPPFTTPHYPLLGTIYWLSIARTLTFLLHIIISVMAVINHIHPPRPPRRAHLHPIPRRPGHTYAADTLGMYVISARLSRPAEVSPGQLT
ncbi:hypothetical protein E2C01_002016 [Portunus trituberculatus]|uniref:Uncharacterized protein n=1 Tax=Portunus trituberculatus TaxID=210409 RepID=A0A5B7CJF7_PORTR|nr:hypothetical protein [Portunus trituberculatus]